MTHGVADRVRTLLRIDALPPVCSDSDEELEWLLACGDELAAKGWMRWSPPLETAAVLCEGLSSDRLCLAGARRMWPACDAT